MYRNGYQGCTNFIKSMSINYHLRTWKRRKVKTQARIKEGNTKGENRKNAAAGCRKKARRDTAKQSNESRCSSTARLCERKEVTQLISAGRGDA